MALPHEFVLAISPFMTESTSEDFLHEMIVCCYSIKEIYKGKKLVEYAYKSISEIIKKENKEVRYLYNPYKNISLDQCVGDSIKPVSDWLNVSTWSEWD